MIKLFILSAAIPYPLNAGGKISQFAILERLQYKLEVTLCLTVYNNLNLDAVQKLKMLLPAVSIEIIDCIPPQVKPPSLIQIIKKKVKQNVKNLFSFLIKSRQIYQNKTKDEFENHNMIIPYNIKGYHFVSSLISIIKRKEYDVYQIEFYEYIDLVNILPLNKPKVFVHHEIRYQRLITSAVMSNKLKEFKEYIIGTIKSFEEAQLAKYDKIITFSDHDKLLLSIDIPATKIESIPFPILQSAFNKHRIEKLDKLIFVGPETHHPNLEGLKWFIDNCFDSIFKFHKTPLYVVGEWSEAIKKLFSIEGKIIFTSYIKDLVNFSKNSINISPIHIGSGIRTKILYAMAGNCPVVSTSKGAEGLKVVHNEHILIANTPMEFIQAVNKLIMNIKFAQKIASNAYNFVWENYRQENIVEYRTRMYNQLVFKY